MNRFAVALLILVAAGAATSLVATGNARATETDDTRSISVCCAWNAELADGDLTYSIAGGDAAVQEVVRVAVEEWEGEAAVPGLTLTEIGDATAANVEIKFRNGGGQIQGQARRKFDGAGFVKSVDLVVSGKAFGDPNKADIVGRITKHEFGHALGTGHANFSGDLLSTTVSAGISTISQCDIDTVLAANEWKLVNGLAAPQQPTVDHVHCPGPDPTPTPPPGELQTVLVDSIDCSVTGNRLIYTITLVNDDSQAVEGATVSGTREDPRGRTFNFEGDTNADGQVSFRAGRPARGDHIITVQDVVGEGLDFDALLGTSSRTCTV